MLRVVRTCGSSAATAMRARPAAPRVVARRFSKDASSSSQKISPEGKQAARSDKTAPLESTPKGDKKKKQDNVSAKRGGEGDAMSFDQKGNKDAKNMGRAAPSEKTAPKETSSKKQDHQKIVDAMFAQQRSKEEQLDEMEEEEMADDIEEAEIEEAYKNRSLRPRRGGARSAGDFDDKPRRFKPKTEAHIRYATKMMEERKKKEEAEAAALKEEEDNMDIFAKSIKPKGPKDEEEEPGEFVPPKAEKMTPLEAEELLRRARISADRGSKLIKSEQYNEAETLIQSAYYQMKGILPEDHPQVMRVMMELAYLYQVHGRKEMALALYDQCATKWANFLGPKSKEYGSLLANWAELHATLGRHVEAEVKVKEALAILNPIMPPDSELLGGLEANLAAYLMSQNKFEEAYQTSTKALRILEKALGAGHDYTIYCLENLMKMLTDQGKTDTVEELKLIWEQKTKRVFRVLSQAEVEKLMPTDEDIANLPPETTSPPGPRSKSFTPGGKLISHESFVAEMEAFWKKAQKMGLDQQAAMQNVVLEDLLRARVISPQEKEALLARKREQLSQLILEKIKSFTPEQTKLMVKQYIQVQEAAEEVANWEDTNSHTIDAFEIPPDPTAEGGEETPAK